MNLKETLRQAQGDTKNTFRCHTEQTKCVEVSLLNIDSSLKRFFDSAIAPLKMTQVGEEKTLAQNDTSGRRKTLAQNDTSVREKPAPEITPGVNGKARSMLHKFKNQVAYSKSKTNLTMCHAE